MQKHKVVVLGPVGATFSFGAYHDASRMFGVSPGLQKTEFVSVKTNADIVTELVRSSDPCQAILAVDTVVGGKVEESLTSLVGLLGVSKPPVVVGALRKRIHFALMSHVPLHQVVGVVGHEKALLACRQKLLGMRVETRVVPSNGEAIERVAWKDGYGNWAALGPAESATDYGLTVLESASEDAPATTSFLLLSNREEKPVPKRRNKVIVIFRLGHRPGALAQAIGTLEDFNMTGIHSSYTGNGTYDFLAELECSHDEIPRCRKALNLFESLTEKSVVLGPFPVRSLQ